MDALPGHIVALVRLGRTTEAAALIRSETGVDLESAEAAVRRLRDTLPPLENEPVDFDDPAEPTTAPAAAPPSAARAVLVIAVAFALAVLGAVMAFLAA